jgi:hypothetical protein
MVASEEVLSEQSYLVARGVRALGLGGHLQVEDRDDLLRVATQVERAGREGCLSFVLDHRDGSASYGYAAGRWALDLYEWAILSPHVPEKQRDRIIGLLLGYSGPSIARYEDEGCGRRFASESAG